MVNWIDHIEGVVEGTPVNRSNLMAMQGFETLTTSISKADGMTTITETNASNEQKVTTISKADGVTTVVAVFTATDGSTITVTTTINKSNGVTTINKVVS